MIDLGIIDPGWRLTDRDPCQPPWEEVKHKDWQQRRMEVYAAQIDCMDQGIGRILSALDHMGHLENTLIFFLADNGGCAEEIDEAWGAYLVGRIAHEETRDGRKVRFGNNPAELPGGEDTYQSYGAAWANLSNTPFREYKHWVHEGGIATPLIVHWPEGITDRDTLRHQPAQLPDIMATCLAAAGVPQPDSRDSCAVKPLEGFSMLPIFEDADGLRAVLYWEHEGNRAVRKGRWKLVCKHPGDWELYDMVEDRTELNNLSSVHTEIVSELRGLYDTWAGRCSVRPWEVVNGGIFGQNNGYDTESTWAIRLLEPSLPISKITLIWSGLDSGVNSHLPGANQIVGLNRHSMVDTKSAELNRLKRVLDI